MSIPSVLSPNNEPTSREPIQIEIYFDSKNIPSKEEEVDNSMLSIERYIIRTKKNNDDIVRVSHHIKRHFGGFLIIILVLISQNRKIIDIIDKQILLEKKCAYFTQNLRLDNFTHYYIKDDVNLDEEYGNYIVISDQEIRNQDDFEITIDYNGIITITGDNTSDIYCSVMLSPWGISLPEGDYILDDGGASDADVCYMYCCGINEKNGIRESTLLCRLPTSNRFVVEKGKYDYYWYGIMITPRFEGKEFRFTPRILLADKKSGHESLVPSVFSSVKNSEHMYCFSISYIDNFDISKIPYDDWLLFKKSLQYQFSDKKWVSILSYDGTGLCFQKDGNGIVCKYGAVDGLGRVLADGMFINDEKETLELQIQHCYLQ